MKAAELRTKKVKDLQTELNELLREQFNLRMQFGTGQMSRTHQFKEVRHGIARIKTVLNEKQREGSDNG